MFQFPGSSLAYLCIQHAILQLYCSGFSHSVISGSKDAYSSPKHIAVSHDLHRHLVPRHPPYALIHLTILLCILTYCIKQYTNSWSFSTCKNTANIPILFGYCNLFFSIYFVTIRKCVQPPIYTALCDADQLSFIFLKPNHIFKDLIMVWYFAIRKNHSPLNRTYSPLTWFRRRYLEVNGIEPMTYCVQGSCSPSWATPPFWAWVESNHRPYDYQSYALTNWATGPLPLK